MKIAIIDQKVTPYKHGVVQGGVQSIIANQLKLLNYENVCHEIIFLTSANSDDCTYPGVKTVKLSVNSKYFSELEGRKYNIKRNNDIKNYLDNFAPDIIINHDQSNNSVVNMLSWLDYPSITYMHNTPEVIGGIAGLSYIDVMAKYAEKNKLNVCVSSASMSDWRNYFYKYDHDKRDPSLYFNTYHHCPVNFDDIQVNNAKDYVLMISRISEDKRIHSAIELCKKAGKRFLLVHTSPRNDSEKEYFKKIEGMLSENERFCDLPRDEVLGLLSEAQYLIVAGPESFGIVGLEANLYGVPVILYNSKENHAILEACSFGKAYNSVTQIKGSKQNCVDKLRSLNGESLSNRLDISELTRKNFCPKKSYERLMTLIDKAISINKTTTCGLETFF